MGGDISCRRRREKEVEGGGGGGEEWLRKRTKEEGRKEVEMRGDNNRKRKCMPCHT